MSKVLGFIERDASTLTQKITRVSPVKTVPARPSFRAEKESCLHGVCSSIDPLH
jgi:hypothetical protein